MNGNECTSNIINKLTVNYELTSLKSIKFIKENKLKSIIPRCDNGQ